MDDNADSQGLIDQLATRIRAIMEDTSAIALLRAPWGDPARAEAIDDLEDAAGRITAIVGAIRALGV